MSEGVLYGREKERESKKEVERESKKELRVQACFMLARMRTPSSLVRERERGRETKREGEKEGERCRVCPELLFLFLKGMAGALAPFSYLVKT